MNTVQINNLENHDQHRQQLPAEPDAPCERQVELIDAPGIPPAAETFLRTGAQRRARTEIRKNWMMSQPEFEEALCDKCQAADQRFILQIGDPG
ncbi:hypothetical protein LNP74_19730 [Klebsiella pneumoniae subsp. pneumoniae]|nr:hypothetical protein [Klebsiella pneumoniae subsp. pneumoniae]